MKKLAIGLVSLSICVLLIAAFIGTSFGTTGGSSPASATEVSNTVEVVSFGLGQFLPAKGKAQGAPISWSQNSMNVTLEQGDSYVVDMSFHSTIDLWDVEIWPSREIEPFVTTVPSAFSHVESDSDTGLTVRAFAPTTAEPGLYEGTLHLRQSKADGGHGTAGPGRTYPETLKVSIVVTEAPPGKEVIEPALFDGNRTSVDPTSGLTVVSHRVLVSFASWVSDEDIEAVLQEYELEIVGQISVVGIYQLEINDQGAPWDLAELLMEDSRVAAATVDPVINGAMVPTDPYWTSTNDSRRWGFEKIEMPTAWDITTGSSSVTLAVVDSGVKLNHDEFSGRIIRGTDYVDGGDPEDEHGHGTRVAGIMAAQGNGGNPSPLAGMAGMCWDCNLLVIRVLDHNNSGDNMTGMAGVTRAAGAGAKVINASFGAADTPILLRVLWNRTIASAETTGALVVASAGNDALDESSAKNYPSLNSRVLSVGATERSDVRRSRSNYGPTVDVCAPGSDISTTSKTGGYGPFTGTSAAAPFASGLAGLIWSVDYEDDQDFDLSPADVKRIIEESADAADSDFGGGRINAVKALCQAQGELGMVQYDADGDGIMNACDNCPDTYNPSQTDSNGDGIGDVCDTSTPDEFFFDDFNDGVIDSSKWMDNGRTGGSVTESGGVMRVTVSNSNDIQYMTIPDFLLDNHTITIEFSVQAAYVSSDKNAGFWLGDDTGTVGFHCDFSQKWQRFTTPFGMLGPQAGTAPVAVGPGSPYHLVKITKQGDEYCIWLDDRFVGCGTSSQPSSLHLSGGRKWLSSYSSEFATLNFDWIKVTVSPD